MAFENVSHPFDKLKKSFKKFPREAKKAGQIALFRIGNEMRNDAVKFAPVKSGDLRRSITFFPNTPSAMGNQVSVGSNKKYARIQDFGGIVKPKRSQYLTIPLPGKRGSIRNYPGGFFVRSKRGNLLYVRKRGKHGIEPLFVLKKQIQIKGKPYLSRAFNTMKSGRSGVIVKQEFAKIFKRI